jgi:hypothetical protein
MLVVLLELVNMCVGLLEIINMDFMLLELFSIGIYDMILYDDVGIII